MFVERKQEKPLGELLVQNGIIRPDQLQHALAEQQRSPEALGKTLVRLGYAREEDVLSALQGMLVVIFRLKSEDFAFEALFVQEIIRWHEVYKLPKMPAYVEGLLNHRERIVPVLSLALRLGQPRGEVTGETRVIIVERSRQAFGLLVDSVEAVTQLPLETIDTNSSLLHSIDSRFLYGVGKYEKRIITLLHLEPVLAEVPLREMPMGREGTA